MYELAVQRSEAPIIFSFRFRHGSNPSVKYIAYEIQNMGKNPWRKDMSVSFYRCLKSHRRGNFFLLKYELFDQPDDWM